MLVKQLSAITIVLNLIGYHVSTDSITLSETMQNYLRAVSIREHPALTTCREKTQKMSTGKMQISPEQGQFLSMLVKFLNAKKTLDLGVFTGYSSSVVALALPENGIVTAIDKNLEWAKLAKQTWGQAEILEKIDFHLGDAESILKGLIDSNGKETYDFAFIDLDKKNYDIYYELCLVLVRKYGVIALDNVFYGGKVADKQENDENTEAIRSLNKKLHTDLRIELSMLPIVDGLTLCRKVK